MIDDACKGIKADAAFADACVAILVTSQGIEAVVQMDGLQAGKADALVKAGEYAIEVVYDIVAAVPDMAGIEADAQLAAAVYLLDDSRDFLKAAANLSTFAGHGLQQYGRRLSGGEHFVQQPGNACNACFGTLAYVAAGVEIVEISEASGMIVGK